MKPYPIALVVVVATLLAGCAPERLRGVNLLQSRQVSYTQAPTAQSLKHLRSLGANAVAVVVFLEQRAPDATSIERSRAVTDAQLIGAIRAAHRRGLKVLIKPQMLVENSWAGRIEPSGDAGWQAWFDAYTGHLLHYAAIATAERAQGLVIGTELRRTDTRPEWREIIAKLRSIYTGELSYAAHDIDGLTIFAHWELLDSAAVTLYPSLGADPDREAMRVHVDAAIRRLRAAAGEIGKPVWIAEIGIQSRRGAQENPWEWRNPDPDAPAAADLQAEVIDLWLEALSGEWNKGVLLWAWSNDPSAGGAADRDYLLQNKPVEEVLRCRWSQEC